MRGFLNPRRRRSRLALPRTNIFLLSKLTKLAFFGVLALVILVPALFLWYSRGLPKPGQIVYSKFSDATRIYDRKGVLLYSVYQDQNRTYVNLNDIPEKLREATIAIEDEDFYKNKGFSLIGYLRVVRNVFLLRGLAGGSTITQQLVKNVLLTSERSVERKIREFILAIQVDRKFSKDQILEMYLNNIPYGGTAIGVEAAAETYFGKKAKDLTLSESAFLAGLPQSPSLYSPFTGNTYYIDRSKAVLKQMVANKYITKLEMDKALKEIEAFKFTERESNLKAPHFVLYVKKLLSDEFGEHFTETGGLQVTTTLDYELQKKAEEVVKTEIDKLKKYNASNGAVVITHPKTGEILAMVGSKDYFDTENQGNFNVAWQGERQPGSSLKPVIYATAFEKGYTPATMLMDVQTEFPTNDPTQPIYTPVNYSGKFSGPAQLRFTLGNSLNIPAVKLLAKVGIKDAMQKGYEMGIQNWEPTSDHLKSVGLSLVLGGREVTLLDEVKAYGVFANGGVKQDLVSILKVTDNKGKEILKYKERTGERVLSEEVSFLISHILSDNNARIQEFGPNSFLRIPGKTVAVKTGTTDLKRDNWAIGYTPSYVVGVWVGNNDNTPMNKAIASGATGASPIWYQLMREVLKDGKDEQFKIPDNVFAMQVDSFAGGVQVDGIPTRAEYFIKGTEPTAKSPVYMKEYFVFIEEDPVSTDGVNRWQKGIDEWIEKIHKDDPKYHAPDDVKNPKQPEPTPTPTPGGSDPTETPTPTLTPTP